MGLETRPNRVVMVAAVAKDATEEAAERDLVVVVTPPFVLPPLVFPPNAETTSSTVRRGRFL